MNSRMNKIRENSQTNSSEKRSNFRKRKFEEDESERPSKRPLLIRNAPCLQPYRPEEADVQTWSRQPIEQQKEQPRRYSANNRLQKIRRSIDQSKALAEVPNNPRLTSQDKSESDPASSSTSTHTASSPGVVGGVSFGQRNSFVVTAKPSSLQERLGKIRKSDSFNKFDLRNDLRQKSETVNTSGGGWFKSVDVEGKNSKNRQDRTATSNVSARNLNLEITFTPENQDRNQTRIIRPVNKSSFLLNNNSKKNNTSPCNDNHMSAYCAEPLSNVIDNNETRYSNSSTSTAGINSSTQAEDMDWDYSEEKEVISNLQDLRRNVKIASTTPQTPFQKVVAQEAKEIQQNKTIHKTIYIVVDTNIFLSHVETVKKAMKLKINGVVSPIILVPWIVIQELDYIKDGRHEYNLKNKAQHAIRFINDCLSNKVNLKGQSIRDAAQQDFASSNFDDSILHCCLQIRDRRNRAILLSNDVNLRNKLMNEDFETYSHANIFKKLDPYHNSFPKSSPIVEKALEENNTIKDIETRLSHMCTYIILKELKKAYGELWNKMGSANKKLPWSLQNCLSLFEQYWIPVFQMHLPKHCLKQIEMFNKSLRAQNGILNNAEKLLNFGLMLCIHLKAGYACYFETITECIDSIQKLYDGI